MKITGIWDGKVFMDWKLSDLGDRWRLDHLPRQGDHVWRPVTDDGPQEGICVDVIGGGEPQEGICVDVIWRVGDDGLFGDVEIHVETQAGSTTLWLDA